MADPYFQSLLTTDPKDVDPEKRPGFTDYLTDIPVGAIKGASQAVQGLLSLGAFCTLVPLFWSGVP